MGRSPCATRHHPLLYLLVEAEHVRSGKCRNKQGYALGRNDASASRPRTRRHRLRTHCCYNLICHSAVMKGAVGIWQSLGRGCHTVAGYSKCCRLSPPHNRHCNRQKWVCVDTIHYKLSVCRGAVVSGRGCDRHSRRGRVCSSSRSPSIERPITVTVTATPCTVLARARCSYIHTKMNHNRCYPHTQPECRDVSSSSCSSQPMGGDDCVRSSEVGDVPAALADGASANDESTVLGLVCLSSLCSSSRRCGTDGVDGVALNSWPHRPVVQGTWSKATAYSVVVFEGPCCWCIECGLACGSRGVSPPCSERYAGVL